MSDCYILQSPKTFNYMRGCADREDMCLDNELDSCFLCQFDRCNNRPIMAAPHNYCSKCTSDCESSYAPSKCGGLMRIGTQEGCFLSFSKKTVAQRGCLSELTGVDTMDGIARCWGNGCNFQHKKSYFNCADYYGEIDAMPVTTPTSDCGAGFLESRVLGCYKVMTSM